MSKTTIETALAKVANILSSSDYSEKAVLILIPNIILADEAATEKVSIPIIRFQFVLRLIEINLIETKSLTVVYPRLRNP